MTISPIKPGSDYKAEFKAAYENRYTWEPNFSGYKGKCYFCYFINQHNIISNFCSAFIYWRNKWNSI